MEYNCDYDTPSNTANFLLEKGKEEGMPLTQLKLIKLVYFSYGWVLATLKTKLFRESIEAWQFGPVVPSLYHEFKKNGREPIKSFSVNADLETSDIRFPQIDSSKESTPILEKVWDVYKQLSASGLVRLSHEKDSPWYKHYKEGEEGIKIPDDDIREHFHKKISEYLGIG